MTYKEKTIEACKKTAYKYRNIRRLGYYFQSRYCSFCQIYSDGRCNGCFMSNEKCFEGCSEFLSFKNAVRQITIYDTKITKKVIEAFEERAKFFDRMVIELENYPEEQFVPETWEYFDIDRNQ